MSHFIISLEGRELPFFTLHLLLAVYISILPILVADKETKYNLHDFLALSNCISRHRTSLSTCISEGCTYIGVLKSVGALMLGPTVTRIGPGRLTSLVQVLHWDSLAHLCIAWMYLVSGHLTVSDQSPDEDFWPSQRLMLGSRFEHQYSCLYFFGFTPLLLLKCHLITAAALNIDMCCNIQGRKFGMLCLKSSSESGHPIWENQV